jgi:[acyl-carrier-protein] S-malonyltransferase
MASAWQEHQATLDEVFGIAAEILGYDLGELVANGPEVDLNRTEVTQPAMLCAGVASWRIASSSGGMPAPAVMAGHSLGEYTALVCAGSIDLADAIGLVARRGQLMQSAVAQGEGAMAVIIGLTDEQVVESCARVEDGVVEAANFNAPGQVAIAGESAAVERAMQNAQEMGARRAMPIPVSVPSHCSLMRGAAEALGEELAELKIEMPSVPVIHNQNAAPASSPQEIRERLELQLYKPVRWVACVEAIRDRGIAGTIECGPGKVLTGLARRIEKSLRAYAVYDDATLASTRQSLQEA